VDHRLWRRPSPGVAAATPVRFMSCCLDLVDRHARAGTARRCRTALRLRAGECGRNSTTKSANRPEVHELGPLFNGPLAKANSRNIEVYRPAAEVDAAHWLWAFCSSCRNRKCRPTRTRVRPPTAVARPPHQARPRSCTCPPMSRGPRLSAGVCSVGRASCGGSSRKIALVTRTRRPWRCPTSVSSTASGGRKMTKPDHQDGRIQAVASRMEVPVPPATGLRPSRPWDRVPVSSGCTSISSTISPTCTDCARAQWRNDASPSSKSRPARD